MADINDISTKSTTKNLDNFFDSIDIFISEPKFGREVNEIFKDGLKVFLKVVFAKDVSIFLLNEEDFTFQHRLTLPIEFSELCIKKFETFVEDGIVGKSLENGKVFYVNANDSETNSPFLLIPMMASWGVMGIIFIELNDDIGEFNEYFTKLFQIHSNILASAIERVQLFNKMKMQNSSLEQQIAVRTLKLNQSQNEIKAIFNSVQTGVFVCDENGIIKNHNKLAQDLIESDNILDNISIFNFLSNVNDENEAELITKKNKKLIVLVNKSETQISDQTMIIYSILDISSRIATQKALLQLNKDLEVIITDRTKDLKESVKQLESEIETRKKAELEISKMLENEKELNVIRSRFIKTVSHEFRTPLTVIKSASQLLDVYGDKLTNQDKSKYINRITKTVDFMTDLMDNVLFLDKDKNNENEKKKINLFKYFQNLKNDSKFNFNEIDLEIEDDIFIEATDNTLDVIIHNLISNAEKYKNEDSIIKIKAVKDFNQVKIQFINEGRGILKSDQNKIFNMFYRGENVINTTGIGLGLAVVKQCVESLGGKIEFFSEVNKTTEFTIYLNLTDG